MKQLSEATTAFIDACRATGLEAIYDTHIEAVRLTYSIHAQYLVTEEFIDKTIVEVKRDFIEHVKARLKEQIKCVVFGPAPKVCGYCGLWSPSTAGGICGRGVRYGNFGFVPAEFGCVYWTEKNEEAFRNGATERSKST